MRRALTLLELLVVIAIIASLTGAMLPGVQKARESANRTRCTNNAKQIVLAFTNHEATLGHVPTGVSVHRTTMGLSRSLPRTSNGP